MSAPSCLICRFKWGFCHSAKVRQAHLWSFLLLHDSALWPCSRWAGASAVPSQVFLRHPASPGPSLLHVCAYPSTCPVPHCFLLRLMLFRILSVTSERSPQHISLREKGNLMAPEVAEGGLGGLEPGLRATRMPCVSLASAVPASLWGRPPSLPSMNKELGHHQPSLATPG